MVTAAAMDTASPQAPGAPKKMPPPPERNTRTAHLVARFHAARDAIAREDKVVVDKVVVVDKQGSGGAVRR